MLAKAHRLTRPAEFTAVVRRGRRYGSKRLVLHVLPRTSPTPHSSSDVRVGFVVSRQVGSAVTRNLVKRRLRHLWKQHQDQVPPDSWVVLRANPTSGNSTNDELKADLLRILRRSTSGLETSSDSSQGTADRTKEENGCTT